MCGPIHHYPRFPAGGPLGNAYTPDTTVIAPGCVVWFDLGIRQHQVNMFAAKQSKRLETLVVELSIPDDGSVAIKKTGKDPHHFDIEQPDPDRFLAMVRRVVAA